MVLNAEEDREMTSEESTKTERTGEGNGRPAAATPSAGQQPFMAERRQLAAKTLRQVQLMKACSAKAR